MRQKGSRNTLVKMDYDMIGDLAGIAGDTARQYALRGVYNPRNLESVLRWVNGRRALNGLPLIGLPSEDVAITGSNDSILFELGQTQNGLLYYDPVRGCYREDEMTGSIAFRR